MTTGTSVYELQQTPSIKGGTLHVTTVADKNTIWVITLMRGHFELVKLQLQQAKRQHKFKTIIFAQASQRAGAPIDTPPHPRVELRPLAKTPAHRTVGKMQLFIKHSSLYKANLS